MPRIAILGSGAIGSVLGAFLSRSGQDVTLIGRAAHVEWIRREGLRVDGALGSFLAPVAAAESLEFRPDFTFLTVKTQDVTAAVRENLEFLADAPLVTFQNGVRSDEIVAGLLPPARILSTVVNLSASYLTPGAVTVVYPGSLVVGRPFGPPDTQVDAVAALLRQVTATRVTAHIRGAHWLKLIVNLNNVFPALTNRTLHQAYAEPSLRRLAVQVMREGLQVADRAGIRLESLPEASVLLVRLVARLPLRLAALLLAAAARRIEAEWPLWGSTLQSLRRGRRTEVDYLNGEIVRLGRERDVPTPLNEALVEMVHETEETGRFWSAAEIRSRLGAGP